MPLGGFATSRTPLAAVAARGAEDNINVSVDDPADVSLSPYYVLVLLVVLLYVIWRLFFIPRFAEIS